MSSIPIWRQIQKKNFSSFEPLIEFLELSPELREKVLKKPRFPINIPIRLAKKMEKNNLNDPIFRQFVPLEEEQSQTPGFSLEPLQDVSFQKTKKIIHKYQGRALLISTGACVMNCRFCFRQNFPYERVEKSFDEDLEYLKKTPSLSEVILSGGDPLSLSDETLLSLFTSLESIPHIRKIRFHTRFPLGIPERIDDSFLKVLSSTSKQIIFIIHCNHPRELDKEVVAALKKILCLGIPLLNQSVLLKGVNDEEATLLALSEELLQAGVLPYYLHELDRVEGAAHFEADPGKGENLIRYLRKHISGFGVPRLVREIPGQSSKTFLTS